MSEPIPQNTGSVPVRSGKPVVPRRNGLLVFILAAVLIHVVIILPLISLLLSAPPASSDAATFDIDLWSHGQSDVSSEIQTTEDAMVVDIPQNQSAPSSETTRYLSSTGSSTNKQTRQKASGRRGIRRAQAPTGPSDDESAQLGQSDHTAAPEPIVAAEMENNLQSKKTLRAPPVVQKPLKLRPDNTTLARAIAGSGLADLGDIAEGDQTSLNSAAFRHASFFTRVQKMVEQFWHPDVAMQQNDPDAKLIGTKDRTTTLLVVLHSDGRIHHLYIKSPSGAGFLDDAATSAVRMAGPFPNVPEGLISSNDGLVKFLFQFTVEINRNPAIRIRRYD